MEEELNVQSEEYALLKEEQLNNWHREFDAISQKLKIQINRCLEDGTPMSKHTLCSLFENKEFIEHFSKINDFAYMIVAMNIYNYEVKFKVGNTILDIVNSIDEVITVIRQIKFLLWEIEFLHSGDAKEIIRNYVNDMNISKPMIEYMAQVSCYDKVRISDVLEEIFL